MALVTFLVMHYTRAARSIRWRRARIHCRRGPEGPRQALRPRQPLWEQFAIFIGKAVRGDFGFSFVYKTRTVAEILKETFPISLFLGSMALALAVAGGLTLGILAAVHQNRGWDYVSVSLATVGVAVPNSSSPSS